MTRCFNPTAFQIPFQHLCISTRVFQPQSVYKLSKMFQTQCVSIPIRSLLHIIGRSNLDIFQPQRVLTPNLNVFSTQCKHIIFKQPCISTPMYFRSGMLQIPSQSLVQPQYGFRADCFPTPMYFYAHVFQPGNIANSTRCNSRAFQPQGVSIPLHFNAGSFQPLYVQPRGVSCFNTPAWPNLAPSSTFTTSKCNIRA